MPLEPASHIEQSVLVWPGTCLHVSDGANLGDTLGFGDGLMLDDVYSLTPGTQTQRLTLRADVDGRMEVAYGSALGRVGAALHLDCAVTLMPPDGGVIDGIVLVEVDTDDHVAETYLLPLAPLNPQSHYAIVGIDPDGARAAFAHLASARFTRGTHITMGTGAQVAIEALRVGDRVLTRNDGVQEVRWIGQSTLRATGATAPIRIRAGTLNNAHDLVVSPDHRLFIYQRSDHLGAGRAELLVKARHLVNGETVTVQEGGFVDYFELVFDTHQIIYAEGIAAESMLIDPRTEPSVPEEMRALLVGHSGSSFDGLDVTEALLDRPDIAEVLRRASSR